MLTSLLVTTMSCSRFDQSSEEFAFGACRHFALLLASPWGRLPNPPLPPSSKYAAYPVLSGIPATVAALKHLHPEAILDAFAEVPAASPFSLLQNRPLSPLCFCFLTGLQAGGSGGSQSSPALLICLFECTATDSTLHQQGASQHRQLWTCCR